MRDHGNFYIHGIRSEPAMADTKDAINPAAEDVVGRISLGASVDADRRGR